MTARGQFFFNPPEPTGFNATTLGLIKDAYGDYSVAIGTGASVGVGATQALAIGFGSAVTTPSSIAMGISNSLLGTTTKNIVVGINNKITPWSNGRIVIGNNVNDTATSGSSSGITIIGTDTTVTNITSSASGNITIVLPTGTFYSQSAGNSNVIISPSPAHNAAIGNNNVLIGNAVNASSFAGSNVVIGTGANAQNNLSVVIGASANGGLGGSVALGNAALSNASSGVALGQSSSTSNGTSYSIAIGYTAVCNSSGLSAIALGSNSTSNATNSIALGANASTSVIYSLALQRGLPRMSGALAVQPSIVAPMQTTAGNSQWEIATLAASTTTATQTEALGANSDRLVMPNNSGWFFKAYVMAHRSDVQGDHMAWEYSGAISRGATASTTALIGAPASSVFNTGTLAWSVAISADTTNGALKFQVTGEASKTIQWLIRCDTVEMCA